MIDRFEARLMTTLVAYAEGGVMPIEPLEIAEGAIGSRRAGRHMRFLSTLRPAARLAIVVALVAALLLAAIAVGGLLQRRPDSLPTGNGAIILPLGTGTQAVAMAADGSRSDLHLPIHSRSCPTFSPDGRSLAYLTTPGPGIDSSEHLAVSRPDGSDQRVLWSGRFNEQLFHQVIWSRDSRHVAATLARTDPDPNSGNSLVVGHRDGSPATILDWSVGEFPGTLAWSPTSRELAAIVSLDDSDSGIVVRSLEGGQPRTVVRAPEIRSIAWSPDGTILAYTGTTAAEPAGAPHLFFVDANGSDPVAIGTNVAGREGFLAWSPDGSLLAVLVFDSGTYDSETFSTRVVDRAGREIRRFGPFPMQANLSFTWSPDGRSLLYTTGVNDTALGQPMIVPIDGSPRRLLDVPANDFYTQCPLTWQAVEP